MDKDLAAAPKQQGGEELPEPVAREGTEGWEALAWHLCADENGEDACNELVWEGGPIPEPWGDRWLKYEGEAKRMIELVGKYAGADQLRTAIAAERGHPQNNADTMSDTPKQPDALPLLPDAEGWVWYDATPYEPGWLSSQEAYTSGQMEDYARAALASQAQRHAAELSTIRQQLEDAVRDGWTDADADAARLALELECLLTDKDVPMPALSRWWDSAHEALELHRARFRTAIAAQGERS